MAESRLIGGYPVIGIRPTIDGRRGPLKVREGLEDQTMGMALRAKKLIEENVKYSNGEPVKVVIADTTIGRVAEAAACEEKFRREGVFEWKMDCEWEELLDYMVGELKEYLVEGKYAALLKASVGVGVGFVSGNLEILHKK